MAQDLRDRHMQVAGGAREFLHLPGKQAEVEELAAAFRVGFAGAAHAVKNDFNRQVNTYRVVHRLAGSIQFEERKALAAECVSG